MEDGPTAAPAQQRLTDSEFVRAVNRGFKAEGAVTDDSPEAKQRNLKRARDELYHIETLHQNSSFGWYYQTIIQRGFKECRESLESIDTPPAALPILHAKFQVWREIARALDTLELEHRRLENPKDPHIEVIRARLDLH